MHILLLGATGNLGLRLLPALLAYGHQVTCYVRSIPKLRGLLTERLFAAVTVVEGDALDQNALESALRAHNCEGIMNTAGNLPFREGGATTRHFIATSISSAAVKVGKERGKPLRTWFIGGLGSLTYPGTGGWKIEDYFPRWGMAHHRVTQEVLTAIPTGDLEWSLLCVAMMKPKEEKPPTDLLEDPNGNYLVVGIDVPPMWEDRWIRKVPVVGVYLNAWVVALGSYTTKLVDVADLLAGSFGVEGEKYVGEVVGMKEVQKAKTV